MSTLLGWFQNPIGDLSPGAVIDKMASARAFPQSEWHEKRTDSQKALWVGGSKKQCSLASEGSLSAAIVGRPRWDDAELAMIAAQRGDASSLIEAYRRHGEGLFRVLRGAFSLAVIDESISRVILAVDRFGIGTMYYSEPKSGGIVFGKNADCVCAHPSVNRAISDQAVFNFLYFGICPSPGTIYHKQFKLLPAQYLIYERGVARTVFYWKMPYRETNDKDVQGLSEELTRLLRVAVHRSIATEEASAIGAFLSGGLDSSTVVGLLSEATDRRAKAFTIGFFHDRYDETRYAEIAAQHFGVQHHKYYLKPNDVVQMLAYLSRASDEPFGNSSVVPAYYCAKMAQESGIGLMLAGDGGDEIFAGNSRYVDQHILGLYTRLPTTVRKYCLEPVLFGLAAVEKLSIGRKLQHYIRRARVPMPDRTETENFYQNVDLGEVLEGDALAAIDPQEPLANLRDAYERADSQSMLQRMLHLDLKVTLADNDLRKVAIASDMAGVPTAHPFLDDDVAEFAAKIPPSLLIRRFRRRWFFREAVKNFLPPEILEKQKHGFGMPYTEWPRQDPVLREIAIDCVQSFGRRHYIRPDFLDRFTTEGPSTAYDGLVWDIMILELWLRERDVSLSRYPSS